MLIVPHLNGCGKQRKFCFFSRVFPPTIKTETGAHYDRLCELFPDCADKIFTLLPEDISDPFGGDLATYRRSAAEIDKGVQAVIESLSR